MHLHDQPGASQMFPIAKVIRQSNLTVLVVNISLTFSLRFSASLASLSRGFRKYSPDSICRSTWKESE